MAGAKRRQRPQGQLSRTRLLDAGLDAFAELSLAELLSEIGPRRVSRQLGDVSVGAFHHHFPKQADYIAQLAVHGVAPGKDDVGPETAALLFELARLPDTDVLGHLERITARDFERVRTGGITALRFQMCLWAKADEPAVQEALRSFYVRLDEHLVPAYEVILERWGREFRPPFTMESATVVFAALLEGLVLRHCAAPDAADATLFAKSIQALLPTMTRPVGDESDLGAAVASIARFTRGPRSGGMDTERRRRLLDATAARADSGTYDEATTEELAAAADTPVDAIYAEYQGKPALAAAAFARFMPLFERPLQSDLDDGRPSVEVVTRHLARLADIAGRHRGLTNAVIEAAQSASIRYGSRIGPNDPRAIVPLSSVLQPAIEAGQAAGELRKDHDASELAILVTNLMLVQIMACPEEAPERAAAMVADVALFGVSARPDSREGCSPPRS